MKIGRRFNSLVLHTPLLLSINNFLKELTLTSLFNPGRLKKSWHTKLIVTMFYSLIITIDTASQNDIRTQMFTITKSEGVIEVWSTQNSRWLPYQNSTQLTNGSTIATRNAAKLQITFEPATIMDIKENSVIKLSNLQANDSKKMIRTMITIQSGDINLKTTEVNNVTLLLSVATPSALISIHNADIGIRVVNDSTIVRVRSGEAKIENSISAIKSVVPANNEAIVTTSKPDVHVISLNKIPPKENTTSKQPSIAILSIQANGINKDNVSHVANYVAEQYQEASSGSKVLYLDDIKELLRAEQGERLLDCFTDSCISQIGNVLGVDIVIIGNLGQLGTNYMFSLKMIDILRDKTIKRVTKTVSSDVGLIINEIPQMVNDLASVQNTATPEPVKSSSTNKSVESKFNEKEIWIKGGSFKMGVDFDGKTFDAVPLHTVNVKGFYMDKYEVTRAEFQSVMGFNPSRFRGCDQCPAENVTWDEAEQYCKKIGKRLPTEAEWEFACKAGTATKFYYGDVLSGEHANFDSRYPYGGVPVSTPKDRPILVGEYKPNGWGLYDMHGNVAEWCSDWYDAAYYGNSPDTNPKGPTEGKLKVVRGGAWNGAATALLSGKRFAYNPQIRLPSIGLRCVKEDYNKE